MKKKKWIYSIFSIVVILSLVIFLVVVQIKREKEDDSKKETFATAFSVNIPSEIDMVVGTELKLLPGYASIAPAEMISKVEIIVSPKSTENINGLTFENDTIFANNVGEYTIKFSVPKSQMQKINRTVNVNVCEETLNSHIQQTKNSITVNETTKIQELFSIKNLSYDISTDENLTLNDLNLSSQNVGEGKIYFSFTDGYLKYNYNFTIEIKEQARYQILVEGIENNILNLSLGSSTYINYEIIDREEGNVSQLVTAISENENIVVVESIIKPLIKITAISTGETIISIICSQDTSITLTINIIVN